MSKLKLVLDSNEYVFYFNDNSDMLKILELGNIEIYLTDLIFKEVIRNIRKEAIKSFFNLSKNPKFIIVEDKIPQILIDKYKGIGLKKGDMVISAFCEFVNADYLITENRDFLKSMKFDKFVVLSLREFLNLKIIK